MVYLLVFIILVTGTVGCGCVEKDYVYERTFYSRLTKENEKAQPSTSVPIEDDIIYRVAVWNNREESCPHKTLHILIPRKQIMNFLDAIEETFHKVKGLTQSERRVLNGLYIFQDSMEESKTYVTTVGIITKFQEQHCKAACNNGLNSITKVKKKYKEYIAQNKNNGQIEVERDLLIETFDAIELVRNELLKGIDLWVYVLKIVDDNNTRKGCCKRISWYNAGHKLNKDEQNDIQKLNRLFLEEMPKGIKIITLCK